MRFYSRYGKELEQIKSLLEIKLKQLSLAYTIENRLPAESIQISARVKTMDSFIKKLERKGWPNFYYPTEVINDLIGARIICWFIDDCYGILEYIKSSCQIKVKNDLIEDYIKFPKDSGYRSLHILADIPYDSVQKKDGVIKIVNEEIICEIQIRTKLQDAWGDVTHEFHYKAKNIGINNVGYESFLADISERLAIEDKTLIKFRNVYQNLADEKQKQGKREGFKDND